MRFPCVMRPWPPSTVYGTLGRAIPKHLASRTVLIQRIKQLCVRRREGDAERSKTPALPSAFQATEAAKTHQKKTSALWRSGPRTWAAG